MPSSRSCARWRRCRPRRRSAATISTSCSACPGARSRSSSTTSPRPQRILDEDHYGLEKVKDRIVEYLAVQARTNKLKGPILCLVGPPGVGKTSLGRSIARATGREFVRQSLGGVRDEAEIRGHRRTYIGSLPGKIVTNLKKAGTSNPLFLLDEIDKLGQDFRGDPASALLEVLDPEQNSAASRTIIWRSTTIFRDVMFVTTANTMDMPQPLLDRMEIIRLEGYTEDEKVEIATRHLIPKQIEAHGLKDGELTLTEEGLRALIRHYTREAGVRTLEREIAKVARKALRQILEGKAEKIEVDADNLGDLPRRAPLPPRHERGGGPDRRGHRPRLDRGRRRIADHRGGHRSRQGPDQDHRQIGRRHAGVDPGGLLVRARPRAELRRQAERLLAARTSTSICPKARCPRTGRRPASAWSPRSSRPSPASRCAATWR